MSGQINKITVTGGANAGVYEGAHLEQDKRQHLRLLAEKLIQSHDHGPKFTFIDEDGGKKQFDRTEVTAITIDFDI